MAAAAATLAPLLTLPLILAALGFLSSTRTYLLWMDRLSPLAGLAVYYVLITLTVLTLQWLGLIVGAVRFSGLRHTLGTVMIIFAYFIVFDWESCYVNYVTRGRCEQRELSNVYLQSEDGAVFYLWSKLLRSWTLRRWAAFVFTPFLLALLGGILLFGTSGGGKVSASSLL